MEFALDFDLETIRPVYKKQYLINDWVDTTTLGATNFQPFKIASSKYRYSTTATTEAVICTEYLDAVWKCFNEAAWYETAANSTATYWQWGCDEPIIQKTPVDRLREVIERRCAPAIFTRRKSIVVNADERELRARETLRRVIGDEKYQSFMKNGFVSAKARSGLVYQIFPGHGITAVFDKGIMIDRLCVVLRGDFPPTDSLIVRYLMILNNEQQFRGLAIHHTPNQKDRSELNRPVVDPFLLPIPDKSLVEIFKSLKKVA